MFQENDFSYISGSNFPRSKNFYTFPYKEAKFSKLILFSLYDIFFYSQQAFVFPFLRDICNVHDHIAAFFLFLLLQKDFGIFHDLYFVVFLYFLDNIQLISFYTFLHMEKNCKKIIKKFIKKGGFIERFKNVTLKFQLYHGLHNSQNFSID